MLSLLITVSTVTEIVRVLAAPAGGGVTLTSLVSYHKHRNFSRTVQDFKLSFIIKFAFNIFPLK